MGMTSLDGPACFGNKVRHARGQSRFEGDGR